MQRTGVLKKAGAELVEGKCFGWAASLAYYFFLALFPALLFVVSLAGVLPVEHLLDRIVTMLSRVAPDAPDTTHEWSLMTLGSVAVRMYVSQFADYQKTYGAIGGVMIALLWFYLTSLAVLIGAQLDAAIEPRVSDCSCRDHSARARCRSRKYPTAVSPRASRTTKT